MNNIKLDVKKLELLKMGASKDKQRYVINGILVKDFKKNDKFYRDYVSTDGKILLLIREPIEKIEIDKKFNSNELILFFDKIKLSNKFKNMEELKIDFQVMNNHYLVNNDFGIQLEFDNDVVYPKYNNVIPDNIKEFDKQFIIDSQYLEVCKKFFLTKTREIGKHYFYRFYSNGIRQPKVICERIGKLIKLLVVMEMDCSCLTNLEDTNKILKELKEI